MRHWPVSATTLLKSCVTVSVQPVPSARVYLALSIQEVLLLSFRSENMVGDAALARVSHNTAEIVRDGVGPARALGPRVLGVVDPGGLVVVIPIGKYGRRCGTGPCQPQHC